MVREHEARESSKHKNEESSNHFLLGALLGGLAGALAALLISPKSGRELRNSLNSQVSSLLDKTSDFRGNVINKSNGVVSRTQGLARNSTELLTHAKNKTLNNEEEIETRYIPIGEAVKKDDNQTIRIPLDSSDILKKLKEAQIALEEEENKVKH